MILVDSVQNSWEKQVPYDILNVFVQLISHSFFSKVTGMSTTLESAAQ